MDLEPRLSIPDLMWQLEKKKSDFSPKLHNKVQNRKPRLKAGCSLKEPFSGSSMGFQLHGDQKG